jgi:hypothetical protein
MACTLGELQCLFIGKPVWTIEHVSICGTEFATNAAGAPSYLAFSSLHLPPTPNAVSSNNLLLSFELFSGSQLHIDMDDTWQNISHHRITFKPYDKVVKDPVSEVTFKSWPKPLTIEFLEDMYQRWMLDLTGLCWETAEVTELGGGAGGGVGLDEREDSLDGDGRDEML